LRLGLKDYVCEWEKELNIPLINKSADLPLIDYVIDAWKSLDIVKQIEFKDFIFTDKESSIDINKYIFKREKKKKNKFDIKLVDSDRVGLLTVNMEITMLQTDPTTGEKTYQKYPLTKSMLIPLQDKNGYYHIKGKKYYMIYQLVEKSTYTTSTDVSLKSLMPVSVKRNTIDVNDVAGGKYRVPYYNVYIFKREVPIILFFLANGLWYTMDKFGIRDVVEFMSVLPAELEPDKMYFQLSNKCYMSVYRDQFAEKPFIRSIVGGFMLISTNRTTIDVLKDETKWIAQLSNPNNYDKGKNILKYFNRLLDKTTKKILKVPKFYCNNAYDLLKWQMQHFNELRLKDNCDINNKRLRCNEYIVAPLTQDFSRRLNRIISLGDKVTITYLRNKKEITKTITLKNAQGTTKIIEQADIDVLGGQFRPVTEAMKKQLNINYGLEVLKVNNGALKSAGINRGFIIQNVNDNMVKSIDDLQGLVKKASTSKDPVLYIQGIYPTGKKAYFAVPLGD